MMGFLWLVGVPVLIVAIGLIHSYAYYLDVACAKEFTYSWNVHVNLLISIYTSIMLPKLISNNQILFSAMVYFSTLCIPFSCVVG